VKKNNNLKKFLQSSFIVSIFCFFGVLSVFAQEQHLPNESFVIGEFVYDDNYVATTTDCYINIWNPAGAISVNNTLMTADSNGWHHYTFPGSSTLGTWPASMSCGTAGVDLITAEKTFVIATSSASTSTGASASEVANAVWSKDSRTLTDYATDSISTAVWSNPARTLTSFGTLVADIWNSGTRTLSSAVLGSGGSLATKTDTDNASSTIPLAVWNSPARTLTSFGTLVADIWNNGSRTLSSSLLSSGGSLATKDDINSATSTIVAEVLNNRTLINNLNNISAADVWSYGTRSVSLTDPNQIWNVAASSLSNSGSVGKRIVDNLDATVSSRGTSNLTAADVWSAATRTLTDYSSSTISTAVWANAGRTLTNYGNDITAADVWNVLSSTLNSEGTIGKQVATNVVSTSTIAAAVWNSPARTLTSFGTLVADIWNNNVRTLSSALLDSGSTLATQTDVNNATSSISTNVWTNSTRTLLGSWSINTTQTERITAGKIYSVKAYIKNGEQATAPYAAPRITIYDPNNNTIISNATMTLDSTGIYKYSYTVADTATQGNWETVITDEVESGRIIQANNYWEVSGSPAQVIINSMADTIIPTISANTTITNEGSAGYEYQYEWCVVSDPNNVCGGGNDVFYSMAAKFIQPGENWNTTLTADVPSTGNYYFKLVVYFGSDSSGATRTFTATSDTPRIYCGDGSCNNNETCSSCQTDCGQCTNTGGGGGGGGATPTVTPKPETTTPTETKKKTEAKTSNISDLDGDGKVNSVDFSIMLYFWKSRPPFLNPAADMNKDNKVDSVDFSILLYYWAK
jgi:hypothetical protein